MKTDKFLIVWDTICDGWQTANTSDDENVLVPVLYNSYNEAFKVLFEDAYEMLANRTEEELLEYSDESVTVELREQMRVVLESNDVERMKSFLRLHPDCNDNDDFIASEEDFILGRKAIFIGKD